MTKLMDVQHQREERRSEELVMDTEGTTIVFLFH